MRLLPIRVAGLHECRPVQISRLIDLLHKLLQELLKLRKTSRSAILEGNFERDVVLGSRVLWYGDAVCLLLAGPK